MSKFYQSASFGTFSDGQQMYNQYGGGGGEAAMGGDDGFAYGVGLGYRTSNADGGVANRPESCDEDSLNASTKAAAAKRRKGTAQQSATATPTAADDEEALLATLRGRALPLTLSSRFAVLGLVDHLVAEERAAALVLELLYTHVLAPLLIRRMESTMAATATTTTNTSIMGVVGNINNTNTTNNGLAAAGGSGHARTLSVAEMARSVRGTTGTAPSDRTSSNANENTISNTAFEMSSLLDRTLIGTSAAALDSNSATLLRLTATTTAGSNSSGLLFAGVGAGGVGADGLVAPAPPPPLLTDAQMATLFGSLLSLRDAHHMLMGHLGERAAAVGAETERLLALVRRTEEEEEEEDNDEDDEEEIDGEGENKEGRAERRRKRRAADLAALATTNIRSVSEAFNHPAVSYYLSQQATYASELLKVAAPAHFLCALVGGGGLRRNINGELIDWGKLNAAKGGSDGGKSKHNTESDAVGGNSDVAGAMNGGLGGGGGSGANDDDVRIASLCRGVVSSNTQIATALELLRQSIAASASAVNSNSSNGGAAEGGNGLGDSASSTGSIGGGGAASSDSIASADFRALLLRSERLSAVQLSEWGPFIAGAVAAIERDLEAARSGIGCTFDTTPTTAAEVMGVVTGSNAANINNGNTFVTATEEQQQLQVAVASPLLRHLLPPKMPSQVAYEEWATAVRRERLQRDAAAAAAAATAATNNSALTNDSNTASSPNASSDLFAGRSPSPGLHFFQHSQQHNGCEEHGAPPTRSLSLGAHPNSAYDAYPPATTATTASMGGGQWGAGGDGRASSPQHIPPRASALHTTFDPHRSAASPLPAGGSGATVINPAPAAPRKLTAAEARLERSIRAVQSVSVDEPTQRLLALMAAPLASSNRLIAVARCLREIQWEDLWLDVTLKIESVSASLPSTARDMMLAGSAEGGNNVADGGNGGGGGGGGAPATAAGALGLGPKRSASIADLRLLRRSRNNVSGKDVSSSTPTTTTTTTTTSGGGIAALLGGPSSAADEEDTRKEKEADERIAKEAMAAVSRVVAKQLGKPLPPNALPPLLTSAAASTASYPPQSEVAEGAPTSDATPASSSPVASAAAAVSELDDFGERWGRNAASARLMGLRQASSLSCTAALLSLDQPLVMTEKQLRGLSRTLQDAKESGGFGSPSSSSASSPGGAAEFSIPGPFRSLATAIGRTLADAFHAASPNNAGSPKGGSGSGSGGGRGVFGFTADDGPRTLLHCGRLQKRFGNLYNRSHERYMLLFNDVLFYVAEEPDRRTMGLAEATVERAQQRRRRHAKAVAQLAKEQRRVAALRQQQEEREAAQRERRAAKEQQQLLQQQQLLSASSNNQGGSGSGERSSNPILAMVSNAGADDASAHASKKKASSATKGGGGAAGTLRASDLADGLLTTSSRAPSSNAIPPLAAAVRSSPLLADEDSLATAGGGGGGGVRGTSAESLNQTLRSGGGGERGASQDHIYGDAATSPSAAAAGAVDDGSVPLSGGFGKSAKKKSKGIGGLFAGCCTGDGTDESADVRRHTAAARTQPPSRSARSAAAAGPPVIVSSSHRASDVGIGSAAANKRLVLVGSHRSEATATTDGDGDNDGFMYDGVPVGVHPAAASGRAGVQQLGSGVYSNANSDNEDGMASDGEGEEDDGRSESPTHRLRGGGLSRQSCGAVTNRNNNQHYPQTSGRASPSPSPGTAALLPPPIVAATAQRTQRLQSLDRRPSMQRMIGGGGGQSTSASLAGGRFGGGTSASLAQHGGGGGATAASQGVRATAGLIAAGAAVSAALPSAAPPTGATATSATAASVLSAAAVEKHSSNGAVASRSAMRYHLSAVFPLRLRPLMQVFDLECDDASLVSATSGKGRIGAFFSFGGAAASAKRVVQSAVEASARDERLKQCCFILVVPSRSYVFLVPTRDEKQRWVFAIRKAIADANMDAPYPGPLSSPYAPWVHRSFHTNSSPQPTLTNSGGGNNVGAATPSSAKGERGLLAAALPSTAGAVSRRSNGDATGLVDDLYHSNSNETPRRGGGGGNGSNNNSFASGRGGGGFGGASTKSSKVHTPSQSAIRMRSPTKASLASVASGAGAGPAFASSSTDPSAALMLLSQQRFGAPPATSVVAAVGSSISNGANSGIAAGSASASAINFNDASSAMFSPRALRATHAFDPIHENASLATKKPPSAMAKKKSIFSVYYEKLTVQQAREVEALRNIIAAARTFALLTYPSSSTSSSANNAASGDERGGADRASHHLSSASRPQGGGAGAGGGWAPIGSNSSTTASGAHISHTNRTSAVPPAPSAAASSAMRGTATGGVPMSFDGSSACADTHHGMCYADAARLGLFASRPRPTLGPLSRLTQQRLVDVHLGQHPLSSYSRDRGRRVAARGEMQVNYDRGTVHHHTAASGGSDAAADGATPRPSHSDDQRRRRRSSASVSGDANSYGAEEGSHSPHRATVRFDSTVAFGRTASDGGPSGGVGGGNSALRRTVGPSGSARKSHVAFVNDAAEVPMAIVGGGGGDTPNAKAPHSVTSPSASVHPASSLVLEQVPMLVVEGSSGSGNGAPAGVAMPMSNTEEDGPFIPSGSGRAAAEEGAELPNHAKFVGGGEGGAEDTAPKSLLTLGDVAPASPMGLGGANTSGGDGEEEEGNPYKRQLESLMVPHADAISSSPCGAGVGGVGGSSSEVVTAAGGLTLPLRHGRTESAAAAAVQGMAFLLQASASFAANPSASTSNAAVHAAATGGTVSSSAAGSSGAGLSLPSAPEPESTTAAAAAQGSNSMRGRPAEINTEIAATGAAGEKDSRTPVVSPHRIPRPRSTSAFAHARALSFGGGDAAAGSPLTSTGAGAGAGGGGIHHQHRTSLRWSTYFRGSAAIGGAGGGVAGPMAANGVVGGDGNAEEDREEAELAAALAAAIRQADEEAAAAAAAEAEAAMSPASRLKKRGGEIGSGDEEGDEDELPSPPVHHAAHAVPRANASAPSSAIRDERSRDRSTGVYRDPIIGANGTLIPSSNTLASPHCDDNTAIVVSEPASDNDNESDSNSSSAFNSPLRRQHLFAAPLPHPPPTQQSQQQQGAVSGDAVAARNSPPPSASAPMAMAASVSATGIGLPISLGSGSAFEVASPPSVSESLGLLGGANAGSTSVNSNNKTSAETSTANGPPPPIVSRPSAVSPAVSPSLSPAASPTRRRGVVVKHAGVTVVSSGGAAATTTPPRRRVAAADGADLTPSRKAKAGGKGYQSLDGSTK